MLAACVVLMAVLPQYRVAVIVGPLWLLVLLGVYQLKEKLGRK